MYKHCTTEESVLRQRQLERCLMDLMQSTPYAQITIGDICDLAGVSRKSFYRYFGSKDGCLCALMDHSIIDGASYYLPDQQEQQNVRTIYERFFGYWKQMTPLLDALAKSGLSLHLVERMIVYMEEEERDLHPYLGSDVYDSHERMMFMISGVMGLLLSWHHSGYKKSISQMAAVMEKVIQK